MSRDKFLKKQRNTAIKEAYAKMESEKMELRNGRTVQKYTRGYILGKLSDRFFLAPDTISDILLESEVEDENPNQLDMFTNDNE